MNQQITYRPGHPQKFTATRTFDLGNTNLKAIQGSEVDFDGTLLTIPGHPPISMPQLRGAIKAGWLVPTQSFDPFDQTASRPVSAGVQVRPADGGNPMDNNPRRAIDTSSVDHEEREVANVAQHAAQTAKRNETNYRRGSENRAVRPGEAGYVIEEQDGREVRKLQTPAQSRTDIRRSSEAISAAKRVKVKPGEAPTREEMMAAMTPEQRAEYLQEIAASKAAYDPEGAARLMESSAQVVGHVRAPGTQQKEGFDVTGSVGGGTEIFDAGGTGGKAEESVVEMEGVVFRNTNGPKKGVRLVDKPQVEARQTDRQVEAALAEGNGSPNDELCRKIATAVCPDFPTNYRFDDPMRKKIARLQADYDDRPDIIRAVAAAETDSDTKRRVVEEFPEAFA